MVTDTGDVEIDQNSSWDILVSVCVLGGGCAGALLREAAGLDQQDKGDRFWKDKGCDSAWRGDDGARERGESRTVSTSGPGPGQLVGPLAKLGRNLGEEEG